MEQGLSGGLYDISGAVVALRGAPRWRIVKASLTVASVGRYVASSPATGDVEGHRPVTLPKRKEAGLLNRLPRDAGNGASSTSGHGRGCVRIRCRRAGTHCPTLWISDATSAGSLR